MAKRVNNNFAKCIDTFETLHCLTCKRDIIADIAQFNKPNSNSDHNNVKTTCRITDKQKTKKQNEKDVTNLGRSLKLILLSFPSFTGTRKNRIIQFDSELNTELTNADIKRPNDRPSLILESDKRTISIFVYDLI